MTSPQTYPLLSVNGLVTEFPTKYGWIKAVDGVSLTLHQGQTIALVGESGCGKSVTSQSIMRLVESNNGLITAGTIRFKQQNILQLSNKELRQIRGNQISMIFQEPMTSLNPVYTIGNQLAEVFTIHRRLRRQAAYQEALAMLELVRIPSPQRIMSSYPHQLSGGMLQRVMIAMALSCRPQLLIADEPTTALDVTIQAQILALMQELQQELGMAILFVTHDLGIVAETAQRVLVMYAGRIIEEAPTYELFSRPLHPYTQGLLHSIPSLGTKKERLASIEGRVPSMHELPEGCRFYERCPKRMERCRLSYPPLEAISPERKVSCWLYAKD